MAQDGGEWGARSGAAPRPSGTSGEFAFCGDSVHAVDAKNRVFLPKRFQQGLQLDADGNRVAVLTRGFDGCLYLFPESGLERALQRMNTEAFAPKDMRTLQRAFFASSARITLDSSGRILLPEKLRTLAHIQDEVVMVGVFDRVEIWAKAVWERYEAENENAFDDLEDLLTGGDAPRNERAKGGAA